MNIAFVGLTHLGLNYLAASAEKKFNVIGLDIEKKKIEQLKKLNLSYKEPNLKKTLIKNKKRIIFTNNFEKLRNLDIIFFSPDLKTNSKGKSSTLLLEKLINKSLPNITSKSILIILSQVRPGFTRSIKFDKKRLFYQVETLIFGEALKRALSPERIIVGTYFNIIPKKYKFFLSKFNCPIIKMNYESAELTKISINILLSSSIITSNLLARNCKNTFANWLQIKQALKMDRRIGKYAYIDEGLGISGGNLERDLYSLKEIIKKDKLGIKLINLFIKNSLHMKNWATKIIKKEINKQDSVGIFGLTYKDNTNSIKNSPSIELIKKLKLKNFMTYDPNIENQKIISVLNQSKNIKKILNKSRILVFMTKWKKIDIIFRELKKINLEKKIVIDPYSLFHRTIVETRSKKYFSIGK